MKSLLLAIVLLSGLKSVAQQSTEKELLQLSARIFEWEVQNQFDSLKKAFHQKFIVVSADGSSSRKNDYLKRLRSGDFIHNSIKVEENAAIVSGNIATVVGKGTFSVTVTGKPITLRLSYVEVFTRENAKKQWQVFVMKASVLEN